MTDSPWRDERLQRFYAQFRAFLDAEDQEACVRFALDRLDAGDLDIVTLYEGILAPAAREDRCATGERSLCIWEEHVRTSIVRTVLECCYPHLMKARRRLSGEPPGGRVIIVCPTEEYHDLGARMAADLFTLCGFDVTFVGANTPQTEIIEAAARLGPRYVGVGVTNPYNLLAARRVIGHLRDVRTRTGGTFEILVGGRAFETHPAMVGELGADRLVRGYDDIRRLAGGAG